MGAQHGTAFRVIRPRGEECHQRGEGPIPAWLPINPGPATRSIGRLRTKLLDFVNRTLQAGDQARYRVLTEEPVPKVKRLFSVFEPRPC